MSPKGYMVMTCNDVGIPMTASLGKSNTIFYTEKDNPIRCLSPVKSLI